MDIAVDLIWVRPGISGGVESYIRNLLDGFKAVGSDHRFFLFLSKDNAASFAQYGDADNFTLITTDAVSEASIGRNIWANLHLGRELKKRGLRLCFEPVYSKPVLGVDGIRFVTVIHDLNQWHFPANYSWLKDMIIRFIWRSSVRTSSCIIATSQFVKEDLIDKLPVDPSKIRVIWIPVTADPEDVCDVSELKTRFGLEPGGYFFTVSSLLPHKNLETVLKAVRLLKDGEGRGDLSAGGGRGDSAVGALPFVISGVGGTAESSLKALIEELDISDRVVITGYIDNRLRNTLYRYCRAFLFPSIFEGFGMPPVEALRFGVPLVTTDRTSIPEVTQHRAVYVKDPFDPREWAEYMKNTPASPADFDFSPYDRDTIARRYLELFLETAG